MGMALEGGDGGGSDAKGLGEEGWWSKMHRKGEGMHRRCLVNSRVGS